MTKDHQEKQVRLKIVVNGKAVALTADRESLLGALIKPALEEAHVEDKSDLNRWVFSDSAGVRLDKTDTVGSFKFKQDQEIFLNEKDVHLKVVVNGKAVLLKADPDSLLGSLVEPALEKAKVADKSDLDRWVFSNAAGVQLDKNHTVGSFKFKHDEEIFLNLTAGVVG